MASILALRKTASLNDLIIEANRQLLKREQRVNSLSTQLINNIHRQISSPGSLLLAFGSGFILGELTKSSSKTISRTTKTATLLSVLLNLTSSVNALFTALPLAWLIKTFCIYSPLSKLNRCK